jgi:hypothetical protein
MAGFLDEVKNFCILTVNQGYDAAATSIQLAAGEGSKAPADSEHYNLVWYKNGPDVDDNGIPRYVNPADDPNVEIIRVHSRSGDTLTSVSRGQEGTTAKTHNIAGAFYRLALVPTKKFRDDINAKLNWIRSAFRGKLSAEQVYSGAQTSSAVPFDAEDFDILNNFNEAGALTKFKARETGIYFLYCSLFCQSVTSGDSMTLEFRKNGSTTIEAKRIIWNATTGTVDLTAIVSLLINDTVEVTITTSAGVTIPVSIRTKFIGAAIGLYSTI